MHKSISRAHTIDHVYMVNALSCNAQLWWCHGEKVALLYKPVHFTACCSLHQVSDGALDANPWPGASFITNANEIWDRNVHIWFYKWSHWSSRGDSKFCVLTKGSSAFSKEKGPERAAILSKRAYWKRGSTQSWQRSGHSSFSLSQLILYFPKSGLTLSEMSNQK